jgi:hypothetical protein
MPMIDLSVNEALREAWNDLSAYMAKRFTQEISDEKWLWPRDPSPRDIVDTGNLRRSLRVSQPPDPALLQTDFHWTAPYAAVVHDGAVFRRTDADGNPMSMPARPWTRPVLYDRATIQRYFRARFALAMRNRQPPSPPPAAGGQR